MQKKIMLFIVGLAMTLTMTVHPIKAEDVIRYTDTHEIVVQDSSFIPSNEEIQEWYSIDLPLNEDGSAIYSLEFDTSNVDFTKAGQYEITLTFYKQADHKYQKTFTLNIEEPEPDALGSFDVEWQYISRVLIVIGIGLACYIVITIFLNSLSKRMKYVIVYDNKVVKTLRSRKPLDLDKIKKKTKINEVSSCLTMNREDVPIYLLEMIKEKKYDYAVELKR